MNATSTGSAPGPRTCAALPSIAPGDVLVSGGPFPSTPIYVQFAGAYEGTDVNLITIDGSNLTGSGSVQVTTTRQGHGRSDEIQILDFVGSVGGTWSIYKALEAGGPGSQGSSFLDWNDPSSDVHTAINTMHFYGGNVDVDGFATLVDPRNGQTFGGAHIFKFKNALAETDIQPLGFYDDGLTPSSPEAQPSTACGRSTRVASRHRTRSSL